MTTNNTKICMDNARIEQVNIREIFSDPSFNIRGEITPGDVHDLAEKLKTSGLIHPLLLQPKDLGHYKYRIISGHRRHLAAKTLEWETIECKILYGLSDEEAEDLNYEENASRKDLSLIQEAEAVRRNLVRGYKITEIADKLQQTYDWVRTRKLFLELPEDIRLKADSYKFPDVAIKQLHELKENNQEDKMYTVTRILIDKRLNGERVSIRIADENDTVVKETKTRPTDAQIVKMRDMTVTAFKGYNIFARTAAWVLGDITDKDLLEDIKNDLEVFDIKFDLPKDLK